MARLGPLLAVEYVRPDGDGGAVVYRHVFAEEEPITPEAGARPWLVASADGSQLRIRGGDYTVSKERGIMERVETLENPRKKARKKTTKRRRRRSPARRTTYRRPRSVTVRNPRKKKASRRRKKATKLTVKSVLTPVFGGVLAVVLMKLAAKFIASARAQGKTVPAVLSSNVALAPAVLGLVLLAKAKKVNLRNIGLAMVVVGAAEWFKGFAEKSPALGGFLGGGGVSNATIEGLQHAAPKLTPEYAARQLGLTSARPRLSVPGAMMSGQPLGAFEALEYQAHDAPFDPSADPRLSSLYQGFPDAGGMGALEPGNVPSWDDRGEWGALEPSGLPGVDDPFLGQFFEAPYP